MILLYVYTLERQATMTKFAGAAIVAALIGCLLIGIGRVSESETTNKIGKVCLIIAAVILFAALIWTQTLS